jgi:hypothetical protein
LVIKNVGQLPEIDFGFYIASSFGYHVLKSYAQGKSRGLISVLIWILGKWYL